MVAFGDRKDFLQVLRMWHFLRKCHMRKTCKRDAYESSLNLREQEEPEEVGG